MSSRYVSEFASKHSIFFKCLYWCWASVHHQKQGVTSKGEHPKCNCISFTNSHYDSCSLRIGSENKRKQKNSFCSWISPVRLACFVHGCFILIATWQHYLWKFIFQHINYSKGFLSVFSGALLDCCTYIMIPMWCALS